MRGSVAGPGSAERRAKGPLTKRPSRPLRPKTISPSGRDQSLRQPERAQVAHNAGAREKAPAPCRILLGTDAHARGHNSYDCANGGTASIPFPREPCFNARNVPLGGQGLGGPTHHRGIAEPPPAEKLLSFSALDFLSAPASGDARARHYRR